MVREILALDLDLGIQASISALMCPSGGPMCPAGTAH